MGKKLRKYYNAELGRLGIVKAKKKSVHSSSLGGMRATASARMHHSVTAALGGALFFSRLHWRVYNDEDTSMGSYYPVWERRPKSPGMSRCCSCCLFCLQPKMCCVTMSDLLNVQQLQGPNYSRSVSLVLLKVLLSPSSSQSSPPVLRLFSSSPETSLDFFEAMKVTERKKKREEKLLSTQSPGREEEQ